MFETSHKGTELSVWVGRCCRAIALLAACGSVFAGDEGAWSKVDKVETGRNSLQLGLSSHNGELFKGCSSFVIDVDQYAWFKWNVQARLTRRPRPEREVPLSELRVQLLALQQRPIYVAERTPLKRVATCRFAADAAVLDENFLYVFFKI